MSNDGPGNRATPDIDDALAAASNAIELAKQTAIDQTPGTEIALSSSDATAVKKRMGSAYSTLAHAQHEAEERLADAELALQQKKAELEAQIRALRAEMLPVQKRMARMADGIAAMNLYLGTDEHLDELRDGAPAPAGTPIALRQMVLHMDEEAALLLDDKEHVEGQGFDFQRIETFWQWLLNDPAHLDQVLPEQRGVVALMARATPIDYTGNAIVDASINASNFQSWWLLRNGERLYVMTTEFSVGDRLIPKRDEFTKLFQTDRFGHPIQPGSRDWAKAEEAADGLNRHYMKIALILQGLVERTAIFHPLPDSGVSFLADADYENGKINFIADDELALSDGRPSFKDWLGTLRSGVQVGHRIVGHFPSASGYGRDDTIFVTPRTASSPHPDDIHVIERITDSAIHFKFRRTDTIWKPDPHYYRDIEAQPKNRASYRLPTGSGRGAIWLPLDGVNLDEARYYLRSRTARKDYKTLVPLLRRIIAIRTQEEADEQPFRDLIAAALDAQTLTPPATDGSAYAAELIAWWKTANKWHRALNGDADHERKAQTGILREARRRASSGSIEDVARATAHADHSDALVVAVRSDDFVIIEQQPRRFSEAVVPHNLFVRIHEYTKTGKLRSTSEWKTLSSAQVSRWTIVESSPTWEGWKLDTPVAERHLTDDAIDEAIETIRAWAGTALPDAPILAVRYSEIHKGKRAYAAVYWASEFKERTSYFGRTDNEATKHGRLVMPMQGFGIEIADDRAEVDEWYRTYKRVSDHEWSISNWRDDRGPRSPRDTAYAGELPVASEVWSDPSLEAEEVRKGGLYWDDYVARNAADNARRTIAAAFQDAWRAHREEQRRQRFIDDFGDPELWEAHSKSLDRRRQEEDKLPAGDSARSALFALVVKNNIDWHGKSIAELLAIVGDIPGIPAEALPIVLA